MYYLRLMFWLLGLTCALFLVLGLMKPWMLLWWEDTQNRKKVIKIYGVLAAFFFLCYWVMGMVWPAALQKE